MSKCKKVCTVVSVMFVITACILFSGCTDKTDEVRTYSWSEAVSYEAEEGTLSGTVYIDTQMSGYSGEGYVDGFENEEDSVTVEIQIDETGFYDLNFISASDGASYKENYIYVDGSLEGSVSIVSEEFSDSILARVYLSKGTHKVTISKFWGWIMFDKLMVKKSDELDPDMYVIDKELANENADDCAKRLFSFLVDNYGNHIISGQRCDGMYGNENAAIWGCTGKYPALMEMDMINYSLSMQELGKEAFVTDFATSYWNSGGIVELCWSWNVPTKYIVGDAESAYLTDNTNIDLAKIISKEDQEGYDLLMDDIDAIADQLEILRDNEVPVIWRPLYEAESGVYWWGSSGSEEYKELYNILYNELTVKRGLNNLIWVWNGMDEEWYPGDEYVDIIGWSVVSEPFVYTSQADVFLQAAACSEEHKMVVLSSNTTLFNPDLAFRDGTVWGYFCTQGGEYVLQSEGDNMYSEAYTEIYMLQRVYSDERIISRNELPNLKEYSLK